MDKFENAKSDRIDLLSGKEREAYEYIFDNEPVYQNNLDEHIDCSAGYCSTIVRSLIDKKLITRNEYVTENGINTFELRKAPKNARELDYSLLLAGDMLPPFIGEEKVDIQSDRFTHWLMNLEQEYSQS